VLVSLRSRHVVHFAGNDGLLPKKEKRKALRKRKTPLGLLLGRTEMTQGKKKPPGPIGQLKHQRQIRVGREKKEEPKTSGLLGRIDSKRGKLEVGPRRNPSCSHLVIGRGQTAITK